MSLANRVSNDPAWTSRGLNTVLGLQVVITIG